MSYTFRPGKGGIAAICQRCGKKTHIDQIRREWTSLRVCGDCWDPRNKQMDVKGVPDPQRVPGGALPEPADVFVEPAAQRGDTL